MINQVCSADLATLEELQWLDQVLQRWRSWGPGAAAELLASCSDSGALLQELRLRLQGAPGPRLLVDGIWWSRPFGGVTRVWEQILQLWRLPGLVTPAAARHNLGKENNTCY